MSALESTIRRMFQRKREPLDERMPDGSSSIMPFPSFMDRLKLALPQTDEPGVSSSPSINRANDATPQISQDAPLISSPNFIQRAIEQTRSGTPYVPSINQDNSSQPARPPVAFSRSCSQRSSTVWPMRSGLRERKGASEIPQASRTQALKSRSGWASPGSAGRWPERFNPCESLLTTYSRTAERAACDWIGRGILILPLRWFRSSFWSNRTPATFCAFRFARTNW